MKPERLPNTLRIAGYQPAWLLIFGATLLLGWWAWRQGAYFDGVFYPGAIGLLLLMGLLLLFAPFQGRLHGPALWALVALIALAVWTLVSGIWSPVASAGPSYAARVFAYASFFLLGLWTVLLLRERMVDVLLVFGGIGLAVGIGTVLVLLTGEDSEWYLHSDATLRFPIGYRNANAAFFLCCLWPLLALAVDNARHWAVRAIAVAGGTILIELSILAQSRGSLPATVVAIAVFIALISHRLRAASIMVLAALPVIVATPTLLEVYRYGSDDAAVLTLLHDAGRQIVLTSVLSFALAAFALVAIYPNLNLGPRRVSLISKVGVAIVAVVAVVGASAFVAKHGGPVEFVDQRVDEFTSIGYPDLHDQGVRYGANIGSNRGDFWRVSVETWRSNPVLGAGAGSFEPIYLRERRSLESPQDPHSAEMLMVSEQGFVGVALFITFLVAAAWAVLRSRRLGARAGLISAAALASGVQWLMPASYDWFWQYAGVTAPAIFLLGAAAAPRLIDPAGDLRRPVRFAGAGVCALLAVAMVPAYLADRYVDRADGLASADPAAAVADYERAASLSPLSPTALVHAARLELERDDPQNAIELLHRALEREPDDYAANLVYAQALIAAGSPDARVQVNRLKELSPLAPEIGVLRKQLAS